MPKEEKPDLQDIAKALFPRLPEPKQISEFYEAVGVALSAWQLVEEALYKLFERAVEPRRPGASGCGFHTIESFRAKLKMTDAAVRFALLGAPTEDDRKSLSETWQRLSKKAGDKSLARNAFAHFQSFTYFDEKYKDKRVRLTPHVYDFRAAAGIVTRNEYTLNDLRNHASAFRKLASELNLFVAKIPQAPRKRASPSV